MRVKQFLLWVLILALASTTVACQSASSLSASTVSSLAVLPASAASSQTVQIRSGIYLTATTGPTCTGGAWYSPTCTQPYIGVFVVTELNGAVVTRVMTNGQGQAMVTLPPGKYIVGVGSENIYPRAAPVVVNVLADRYAFVSFSLDLGQRWQVQR